MKTEKRIQSRLKETKYLKSNCERVRKYKLKAYYDGWIEALEWVLKAQFMN